MALETIDIVIIALYALALLGIALAVSRQPKGSTKNTEDYFLAGRALPWWAIGASLIASNISAEQIIGQSGQGYAVGIAIAAYEWQAALVLIIVAKFFLPIFLKRRIYTMPQFLAERYGEGVKTLMSVFWVALYTSVNLTTVVWLGGLAISSLTGWGVFAAMAALAAFAALYSLYGGLKAVALTDIIQVVILIVGGFAITWIALDALAGADGAIAGLGVLMEEMPGHFEMILDRDNPAYGDLPGIWTLLGGLWVLHFSYWGFNQYIIQRALGAESLGEAQKGLAFAAFLKLLVPFIVVIPGIAAVMLAQQGALDGSALAAQSDRTYGELMAFAPAGLRGLVFAALIAAVVSSLASMMNSISTIFTMDLYRSWKPDRSETHYVTVGRITAFAAMAIALVLARPFLGGFDSAFQTVQEYTGFIAPGIVIVFLLGFFDRRANAAGAYTALIGSVAANVVLKFAAPDIPFIIRIWIVFVVALVASMLISRLTGRPREEQTVRLGDIAFGTNALFNTLAVLVIGILVGLYVWLW
ncbi:sodium:solute symporter family transporter [Alteriqipengyuania lutimaris]|uniref:Sodium transporter n=1 Tax=Alteriqipengyuania lutimaris TaxID=1538146 RepID=A0A395LKH8_9SPHN|nr:sodium/solute symporter [Alteriqipengyuania lutimaris]MBB3033841.1 SSS family solute:Na+ symporter [Alteriqipengyuania lutimaris]RDS77189.1 sodium transporter [Alteriqipengyuania lutimaris]